MFVTRRGILAGGLAAATLPALRRLALAQGKQINVFAHRVLQNVSNGTKGGDVTQGVHQADRRDASIGSPSRPARFMTASSAKHP